MDQGPCRWRCASEARCVMTVPIAMIVAMGENGVIGAQGEIPWRLPTDFAHFKRTTLGKPLIMGRKTFESIGRPLPGRTNIVVTRRPAYAPDGVIVARDLSEAIEKAQDIAGRDGASEVMIGGGGEIYRSAMPLAERLLRHTCGRRTCRRCLLSGNRARRMGSDRAVVACSHRAGQRRVLGESLSAAFTSRTLIGAGVPPI